MKITTVASTYTVERNIECISLKDNISIVHIQDTCNGFTVGECYKYIYGNTLHFPMFEKLPKDINFVDLYWLKKDFVDYYRVCECAQDLGKIIKQFGFEDLARFYIALKNNDIDIDNYIPVECNWSDGNIYPFTYGKTSCGWFAHKLPYSTAYYHVTNREYDLPMLAAFLRKEEELGNVQICRKRGDDLDTIIYPVPVYNRNEEETHYINFNVLVDSAEEYRDMVKDWSDLRTNPKWKKLIEPYKCRKNI